MGFLKAIFTGFISLLLVILLILLSLTISINQLLYPDIYRAALEKTDLEGLIAQNSEKIPMIDFVVLPEGGIMGLFYEKLENLLAYLRYETDTLDLKIRLDKDELVSFYEQKASEIPVCVNDADFSWENITCRPKNISINDFLTTGLEKMNASVPVDYYDLREGLDKSGKLEELRYNFRLYKTFFYSLIGAIILLVLVLFLIFINTPARFIGIIGIIGFVAGSISYSLSYFFAKITNQALANMDTSQNMILDTLKPAIEEIITTLITKINLIAFMMIIIGMMLFILSFIFKKNSEEEED